MHGDQQRDSIQIEIDELFAGRIDPDYLHTVLLHTLTAESTPQSLVTVVITDDESIRSLNKEFLGNDAPTDVLAFPLDEGSDADAFVLPEGTEQQLGEIFISLPVAERQASEQGISLQQEIGHLLTHGALHLLGYDHIEEDDDLRMRAREELLLAEQGIVVRHGPVGH